MLKQIWYNIDKKPKTYERNKNGAKQKKSNPEQDLDEWSMY